MMLTLIGESLKLAGETLKAAVDVAAETAAETVALTGAGEGALAVSEAAKTTALTGVGETFAQAPAVPHLYGAGARAQFLHDAGTAFELSDIFEAIDDLDALEGVDEVAPLPEDQMEQRALGELPKTGKLPRGGSGPAGLYSNPGRLRDNALRGGAAQEYAADSIPDVWGADLVDERRPRSRRKLFRALGAVEGQLESVQNAQSRR